MATVTADKSYLNPCLEHDPVLKRVIVSMLKDHIQLYRPVSDDDGFRKWLADTVFQLTYEGEGASPGARQKKDAERRRKQLLTGELISPRSGVTRAFALSSSTSAVLRTLPQQARPDGPAPRESCRKVSWMTERT